ncbi:MAG: SDR family NAD(P)-dependent oxidoreductase [Haloferacaceae archaeon]
MRVLVAGAAGGIGSSVVRRLIRQGHDVVGVDRDRDGLAALPAPVETRAVDLADERAVRDRLGEPAVDAVVSAVGWYELGALEDCPPAELRRHLDANLVAVHAAVRATLPAVRRRDGRIVVVGSVVGRVSLPFHGAYAAGKAGLHGYVDALRRELDGRGVDVSLVEPGPVRTGLNERAAAGLEGNADSPYAREYDQFRGYSPASVTPDAVASRIEAALTAPDPRARYPVGRRARWLPRLAWLLPPPVFDRLVRAGLPGGVLGRLIDR